ncbi:MAG: phenylalanine--tRNA ligase subunit beta [Acidimicrobiales bacterium]|nr:phenylalanine--tRNA ligase subunit beta [Acidimicrobiales bacterium]
MKVLLSWLREFAPDIVGDPVELGETLSALGLAVEEMTITGEGLDGIVVGKVLDLRPHPDADKIQLVDVDRGDGEALQVCCGAFNMAVGDLIPFATIGTIMPNGMEIAQRKMRGQMSNGMCCSAEEIGLGADAEGIMILEGVGDDQLGAPITEALGIETDVLWDLEVNANRPDAMSVAGVARDLAAGLGIPFAFPEFPFTEGGGPAAESVKTVSEAAKVELLDASLCGRFLARVLRNVTVGTSPQWMQNRLTAAGMRPINSVVDISNYVMLELGQPNHTYDLAKVPNGHLRVRRATEGETITTLDDIERTLTAADGVIANGDDLAVGIAGVMGGASTEISETTTEVLLELAWWDPPSISRTVRRLNLPSEASVRYRRGVDWGVNMERAAARFVQLLQAGSVESGGATTDVGMIDERGTTPDRSPLRVRPAKVNGLLGTELSADAMADHLASIGFVITPAGDDLDVVIPTWRWDTETETDVAEEVARMYGYENIIKTVPKGTDAGALSPYQIARRRVREVLVGAGCDETQPMPFLAPGDLAAAGLPEEGVTLTNPLVHEESVLRTSLLPGQLKTVAYNQSHRIETMRLFEIGHIYLPAPEGQLLPDEREALAVALAGSEAPAAIELLKLLESTFSLPNVQIRPTTPPGLHPTRAAEVVIAGQHRGEVGEVDPVVAEAFGVAGRVAWLQLDLGAVLNGPHGRRRYRRISKYPSSDIDLAFVIADDIAAANAEATIRKAAGDLLVRLDLFDSYRGTGVPDDARSLAYRLRFQAADRTLTDDEVATVRQSVIDTMAKKHGAALR